jgi:Transposase
MQLIEESAHFESDSIGGTFPTRQDISTDLTDFSAATIRNRTLSLGARTIMAKGYSTDLTDRVVALVEGGESCREAARLLDLAASTTIRWMDRWHTTGSVAAKPGTGHCRSPLKPQEQWLLDLGGR